MLDLNVFAIDLAYFAVVIFFDFILLFSGLMLAGSIIYSLIVVTIFMIRSQ